MTLKRQRVLTCVFGLNDGGKVTARDNDVARILKHIWAFYTSYGPRRQLYEHHLTQRNHRHSIFFTELQVGSACDVDFHDLATAWISAYLRFRHHVNMILGNVPEKTLFSRCQLANCYLQLFSKRYYHWPTHRPDPPFDQTRHGPIRSLHLHRSRITLSHLPAKMCDWSKGGCWSMSVDVWVNDTITCIGFQTDIEFQNRLSSHNSTQIQRNFCIFK